MQRINEFVDPLWAFKSHESQSYLEINTSFQLKKDGKQFNVTAFTNIVSNFLKEDIYLYRDNTEPLVERLLRLENIDFHLLQSGKLVTEIRNHPSDKPDQKSHAPDNPNQPSKPLQEDDTREQWLSKICHH